MGRDFDAASDDQLTLETSVLSSADSHAISIWFAAKDLTISHSLMMMGDGTGSNFLSLHAAGGITGDPCRTSKRGSAAATSTCEGAAYVADEWTNLISNSSANNDLSVFKNGGDKTTDTTTTSAVTLNVTRIATATVPTTTSDVVYGPVSVWDAALTDDQVASLGAGRDPRTMATMPILHMPMTGGIQDVVGGRAFTDVNGTTEAGHKPLGWN